MASAAVTIPAQPPMFAAAPTGYPTTTVAGAPTTYTTTTSPIGQAYTTHSTSQSRPGTAPHSNAGTPRLSAQQPHTTTYTTAAAPTTYTTAPTSYTTAAPTTYSTVPTTYATAAAPTTTYTTATAPTSVVHQVGTPGVAPTTSSYEPFIAGTTLVQHKAVSAHTTPYASQTRAVVGAFNSQLYHPPGCTHVPASQPLKGGMYAMYDAHSVPAFEAPLIIGPVPAIREHQTVVEVHKRGVSQGSFGSRDVRSSNRYTSRDVRASARSSRSPGQPQKKKNMCGC